MVETQLGKKGRKKNYHFYVQGRQRLHNLFYGVDQSFKETEKRKKENVDK